MFQSYIRIAETEAKKSPHIHGHGCVAFNSKGDVLAFNHNKLHECFKGKGI